MFIFLGKNEVHDFECAKRVVCKNVWRNHFIGCWIKTVYFSVVFLFLFFLAPPISLFPGILVPWALGSESAESLPLDRQGSPLSVLQLEIFILTISP